jgi:hypothetical protein
LKRSLFLREQVLVTVFEKWLKIDLASIVFFRRREKPELLPIVTSKLLPFTMLSDVSSNARAVLGTSATDFEPARAMPLSAEEP